MGVINLWTELVKYANVCRSWNGSARSAAGAGEARDENAEIVAELCGKVLAIDTSVWLFQCSQQNDLRDAIFDEHARVLYIFIYRIMNLLRYGVTPVFVLEGDTPEAKMGRLNQRSLARGFSGRAVGNRRGGRHDALGRKVVELLDAMGIPHVEAPGEAEAMCAALTVVGPLAHAAVTSDVDALLFGARRVYKECRVQMDSVKLNSVERVDAAEATRRCFGLQDEAGGCVRALQAVACLCGCDYSVAGGKGVGVKTALEAVQQLTVGRQDDSQVIPELLRYLETGPDPRVTALTKCTGCKTCGHEKHGRQPCSICGPGACHPKGSSSPCECEFHRSEPQRKFMRVIARAVTTGPSFSSECRATLAAFDTETQRAHRAAEELQKRLGGSISWSRRPDVQAVFSLMHPLLGHTSSDPNKLLWTYPEVRDKMRPVLVEWDMRQGPEPGAAASRVVEFRPRRIKQVAAKDGGLWAYLLEFDRLPGVNPADAAFDCQQLSNSKLVKGRHVRRVLVEELWPHLQQMKEEEEQAKLANPKKARGGKAAASGGSPGGISGPTAAAGPSGRGGSRAGGAAATRSVVSVSVSATAASVSQRSSDIMHRFLGLGAAAAAGPTTSVQQRPPVYGSQAGGARPGPSLAARAHARGAAGRDAAPAVAEEVGGGGNDNDNDDDDDWMDCEEVQMTQHNSGPGDRAGDAAAGCARAGVAGRSQRQPACGNDGLAGGVETRPAGAAAAAATGGGLVALWGDDADAGEQHSGGGGDDGRRSSGGEGAGHGALYDDLDDVIPTSLDELLAGASKPADRVGRLPQGHERGRTQRKDRVTDAAAPVTDAAAASEAAAAAGPSHVRPFRPQPTGPGPGRAGPAAAGGGAAAGAAAAPVTGECAAPVERTAAGAASGGGGGRGAALPAAVVEVFDLTDSPVGCVAPGARKQATAHTTTAPHTTTTTTAHTIIDSEPGQECCPGDSGGEGRGGCSSYRRGGGGGGGDTRPGDQQQRRRHRQPFSGGVGDEADVGRSGAVGEELEVGEEEGRQEEEEEGEGEGDAVGSAVKPTRRPGAPPFAGGGGGQAVAGSGDDELLGSQLEQEQRQEAQQQQQEEEEASAQQQQQRGFVEAGPGAGEESPAARRARLVRMLFQEGGGPPASAPLAAAAALRPRKADRGGGAAEGVAAGTEALTQRLPVGVGQQQQQPRQLHQGRRPESGSLGSPSKRRNTGDGGVGGGDGGGGGGGDGSKEDGDGGGRRGAPRSGGVAPRPAAAEQVDLTLDDDDDDEQEDVVDLT